MVSPSDVLPKVVDGENEATPRRAKWWYVTFHNVTAMVGAGVLSLPYAMAHLGWGPGIVALLVAWVITLYTLRLLIEMHECVPGVRFDRYRDLGVHALGPRLGIWVVVPQQLIVQVGCDVVYMVNGGNCLQKFAQIVSPSSTPLHQSYWICIFGSSQFLLSQLRDLNSITAISLATAVMSLSYSTISWAACLAKGPVAGVSYAYSTAGTAADTAFRVCGALGQVAFAFAGHGHHPVHAHQAVQDAHVEGHRRRLHGHRRVLLPRGVHRVLGVRAGRKRQRARGARAAALARRGGQHDGCRSRPRKLSGVRHADIREHRNDSDHQVQGSSRSAPPPGGSIYLRRAHPVRRRDFPVLRRPPRRLRRLRLHAHLLLPPLHPVAQDQEASEVQRVLVRQLEVHRRWRAAHACVHHRRAKEHHPGRLHVQVLLLNA